MKIVFNVLAVMVTIFAFWSLILGVQGYLEKGEFQVTSFVIAVIGILLAGLWLKRAKSM
jgi:hypothetical protein